MVDNQIKAIDWRKSNPDNVSLVLSEYEKRLVASANEYSALDAKARWLLTITISIGSALFAYFLASVNISNICASSASAIFAVIMFLSAITTAFSLRTRKYRVGSTLPKQDITDWKPLIEGAQEDALRFSEMRIATMKEAIDINDNSNDKKSNYLTLAIWFGCLAAPLAGLFFLACHIFLLFAVPSAACPII